MEICDCHALDWGLIAAAFIVGLASVPFGVLLELAWQTLRSTPAREVRARLILARSVHPSGLQRWLLEGLIWLWAIVVALGKPRGES